MKYVFPLLFLLAQAVQADVYKSINADGEVVFSDVPAAGAEPVKLPGLSTYKPSRVVEKYGGTPVGETEDDEGPYKSLKVTAPEDDATIWDNQGIATLTVALEPSLLTKSGHQIQYFLDGKAYGKPLPRLSRTYRDIERGTHTISAAVIDAEGGTVISAEPVTIHLHHMSRQHPTSPLFNGNGSGNGAPN
ncbi:MAG: DUF4124 domain-containing protein [Gammaproteobacteria bacterium]|nr:DUF4124 domain-containing protein [Gammaproteobacteria bacterium]